MTPSSISLVYQTANRVGIRWGDRLIELPANVQLIGCRPADWSSEPENLRTVLDTLEQEAPLEPGWRLFDCIFCARRVRMGIRQQTLYSIDPDAFTVTCLLCASLFHTAMDRFFGDGFVQVEHAGGQ